MNRMEISGKKPTREEERRKIRDEETKGTERGGKNDVNDRRPCVHFGR